MRITFLARMALLLLAPALTACDDHLAVAPCQVSVTSYPPGLEGIYELASVEQLPGTSRTEPTTQRIRLVDDSEAGFRVLMNGPLVAMHKRNAFDRHGPVPSMPIGSFFQGLGGVVCKVILDQTTRWVLGSLVEQGTWTLSEIVLHGKGFFLVPLAFQRKELDAAKIPWTPRESRSLDDAIWRATTEEDSFVSIGSGLLVDNRYAPLETLVKVARPHPMVQNFARVSDEFNVRRSHARSGRVWREIGRQVRGTTSAAAGGWDP